MRLRRSMPARPPAPSLPRRAIRPALVAGGLFALVASAWMPAHAAVPAVDDTGARSLATALKSGLTRWFPAPTEDGDGIGFEWEGEPTVKPAGDHYDVALPRLSAEGADGTRFDVGTILLSVTPKDDGLFGLSLTLPSAIKVQNLDDEDEYKDAATIAIGKQAFTGTWSSVLETMLTIDAAYNDLTVGAADGKGKLSVATMTLIEDLKPETGASGATLWSGPIAFALGGLSVLDDKNLEMLKIGGITAEAGYSRVDLTKVTALQKLSEQAASKGTAPASADLLPKLQGLFAGVTSKMRLSNLSATNPEDGTKVSLGQFSFQGGVSDLDQELSTASFGMEARDFAMTPSPAPVAFTPRALEIKVSLAKMPNAALWKAFGELAKSAEAEEAPPKKGAKPAKPAKPPAGPAAADLAMQDTMAAMSKAGTELRVDALTLDTPATAGTASGALRVAAPAAFGVTGGATILLKGIDAAVKAMQPAPGAKPDKETQDLMGGLAMLQAMGQAGKDDSGADIRTYKIDLTEAGQLLLNGADMTPMLGGGSEPAPAPAEKPKGKK